MSENDSGAAGAWSYRQGDWFAVFGDRATVVLPGSQKEQVIALWGLVDGGAGFDEVLDGLLASGLSRLSGFVLVSADDSPTRVLLRGQGVSASIVGADGAESSLDGGASHTWVEQTVDDLTRLTVSLPVDGEHDGGPAGASADLPIVAGLVRVGRIDWPAAVPEPAGSAGSVIAVADDQVDVAADESAEPLPEHGGDETETSSTAAGPGSVVAGAGVAGAGILGAGVVGAGLASSPEAPAVDADAAGDRLPAAEEPDAAGGPVVDAPAEVADEAAPFEDDAISAAAPLAEQPDADGAASEPFTDEQADDATVDDGPATEVLEEVGDDLPAASDGDVLDAPAAAVGDPLTDPLSDPLSDPIGEPADADADAVASPVASDLEAAADVEAAAGDSTSEESAWPDSDDAAPAAPGPDVPPPPPPAPEGWVTPWDNPLDVPPPTGSGTSDPHPLEEPDTPAVPPVLPEGATEAPPSGWAPPPPPSGAGVAEPEPAPEVEADAPPLGIGAWEPVGGAADHDGLTVAGAGEAPEQPANQLPGQPPAPAVTQPVAKLLISDGQTVVVDRAVLIGRAPEARRFSSTEQPTLVAVPSRLHEISSTHVEVRPGTGADHGTAVVTDMGSTNGTVLVQPGLGPEDLKPGIAVQLIPGAIVNLGDGVTIQVTRP